MTGAWRRAAYLLAGVTICSSAVVLAHSDEPGAAPGKESPQALLLKQADAKLDKVGCPTACRMTLRLDQARILQLVPTLQARGLVSHSITPAEVSGHPFYFANAIALLLASDAVRETYEADDGVPPPPTARSRAASALTGAPTCSPLCVPLLEPPPAAASTPSGHQNDATGTIRARTGLSRYSVGASC